MNDIKDLLINYLVNNNILPESLSNIFVIVLTIVFWFLVGIILSFVLRKSLKSYFKIKKNDKRSVTVGRLIGNFVRVTVWFIILVIILSELNVEIAPVLASAGVFGLALGFGAQSMVRDFIGGFFLITEKAYNIGDVIEINGFRGTVINMGLRVTQIRNWKGVVMLVNNGDIRELLNYSKSDSLAIVDFGVSYSTNLSKVTEIMPALLDEVEAKYDMIIEKPQFLGVTDLADSSIDMRIIAKTVPNEHFQVERNIRKDLVEYLNKNKIEIPFPQIVVHDAKS